MVDPHTRSVYHSAPNAAGHNPIVAHTNFKKISDILLRFEKGVAKSQSRRKLRPNFSLFDHVKIRGWARKRSREKIKVGPTTEPAVYI